MATIKKVSKEDFEMVYPLLKQLNNSHISEYEWKQLFINHWDAQEDYFGYALIDRNRAVGFLGLMFSSVMINHVKHKFCNFTSWVVQKEFRGESIKLLIPVLRLRGYTLTSHTMSSGTYFIFKKMGFRDLEDSLVIIPPLPKLGGFSKSHRVIVNSQTITQFLDEENLKIYHDHSNLNAHYILVQTEHDQCFMVATRPIKKNLPFAHLHYISDLNIFAECIEKIRLVVCLQLKVVALLIDKRCLRGERISRSWEYTLPQPRLYKSDYLNKDDITALYSELILLNL
jgi:hypothetical protein